MKMACVSQVTLWIYVTYIMVRGICNEERVFAITGCNATLEWTLGNISDYTDLTKVDVVNSNGNRIARLNGGRCGKENHSKIDCILFNRSATLVLSVVLIDVKPVNRGNYTSQVKKGLTKTGTITKNVIIIDKPRIEKLQENPLKIVCKVTGELDINYKWKINHTDLNSNGIIHANSSTLTFENPRMVPKSSIFSCEVCTNNNCCVASETFDLYRYYSSATQTSLEHGEGLQLKLLGMGLVILAVVLIIVGFLILVKLRHKYISIKPDCSTLHQPLERPANGEDFRGCVIVEKYNRPLPIPPEKENTRRTVKILENPNSHRKSRSLQTLSDHTTDIWNPVRKGTSLQTVIDIPRLIGRCQKSGDSPSMGCYYKKDSWFSIEEPANGIGLEELCSNVCEDNNVSTNEHKTEAESRILNNSLLNSYEQQHQGVLYSSKDEDGFCLPILEWQ
ncbi:hypothetical protein CHS0354_009619 [Potamilus streckersoni]|uniref:Ig-like domain-containing protein n=1 Tax=Potamilus streckersoni TaxID=2493646 RepID=A0AAE0TIU0_9BIVA|nr:hypothetical protein CHS0354_009619 [Potamilus streckersoni]